MILCAYFQICISYYGYHVISLILPLSSIPKWLMNSCFKNLTIVFKISFSDQLENPNIISRKITSQSDNMSSEEGLSHDDIEF
jgi:hypothetical protein